MKLFAKKHGGHDIMTRFASAWGTNRMNPASSRYDPEYTEQMMKAHGTVHAKMKRKTASFDTDQRRAKRAPSAYNLFVKSFMERNKGKYERTEMMQRAAHAWKKQKNKP
jgi:hypothetical protein